MANNALTSRERLLLTMEHKPTDYLPCSFMLFHALEKRCGHDWERFMQAQLDMGLDAVVDLPGAPGAMHPDVAVSEWKEEASPYPILHKKYQTPAGDIKVEVRQTQDWEGGDHISLGSDLNVPRAIRHHVNGRADLKSFRYLLEPPTARQMRAYRERCRQRRAYAQQRGLLLQAGMSSLVDAAIQFAGVEAMVFAAMEDPGYFEEFLSIIWNHNMQRMEIALEQKPDLYIRRGWYENMSFWSPDMYRRFMKPYLEKEARWAKEAGVKFGYINTCSYMPILEDILDIGPDVLIGVDPVEDKRLDMALLKEKTRGRLCLWGGGNGFVTIEEGTKEQVRQEVIRSMGILAPGGGFILSPIDNVVEDTDRAMENAAHFIQTWKEIR